MLQLYQVLSNQKFFVGYPQTYPNCLALTLIKDSNQLINLAFVTFLNELCSMHSYQVTCCYLLCLMSFSFIHQHNRLLDQDLDLLQLNNYCPLTFIKHFCQLIHLFHQTIAQTSQMHPQPVIRQTYLAYFQIILRPLAFHLKVSNQFYQLNHPQVTEIDFTFTFKAIKIVVIQLTIQDVHHIDHLRFTQPPFLIVQNRYLFQCSAILHHHHNFLLHCLLSFKFDVWFLKCIIYCQKHHFILFLNLQQIIFFSYQIQATINYQACYSHQKHSYSK